jgi:hypothetical protein
VCVYMYGNNPRYGVCVCVCVYMYGINARCVYVCLCLCTCMANGINARIINVSECVYRSAAAVFV